MDKIKPKCENCGHPESDHHDPPLIINDEYSGFYGEKAYCYQTNRNSRSGGMCGCMGYTSNSPNKLYIVRLWDMFDGWLDLTSPITKEAADKYWNEKTNNGTQKTKYSDGDYYKIFPANTKMVCTSEFFGR